MLLDPKTSYVQLGPDGTALLLPGGAEFWSLPQAETEKLGGGWLISEYEFTSDWPTWEMHPNGDEFVYLLSGSIELLLEHSVGTTTIAVAGRGAVIVPRGIWHTAKVHARSHVLHITLGVGTQTRPL